MDWIDNCIVKIKRANVSQKDIAHRCRLSEHSVSKIFSRKAVARDNTRMAIETAINEIIEERATNENKI